MFPRHLRLRRAERHHVLKLVAKAVGAARLVARRPRPDPAREGLVEEPAIEQKVHRAIGRPHLNRAEDVIPALGHRAQDGVEIGGSVARDQGGGFRSSPMLHRDKKTTSADSSGASSSWVWRARTGRDRRRRDWRSGVRPPVPLDDRGVPLRPINSVRSPVQASLASGKIGEGDAAAKLGAPMVPARASPRLPHRSPS